MNAQKRIKKMKEKVSVIIPSYNSERTIIGCLQGLERQSFSNFEAIIVDDESTDKSLELISEFKKKSRLKIKILKRKHLGPAAARNLGAKKSKAGIIAFLDSDCIPKKEWLERIIKPLKEKNVAVVSCAYKTENNYSLIARYVGYEIAFRHERMQKKEISVLGSYATAFNKKYFFSAGGFNEEFKVASSEDFYLSHKLYAGGKKLVFLENVFVGHFHPDSLQKYLKQQFKRGYWYAAALSKKRILMNDSYSGFEIQFQFILSIMFLFSIALSIYFMNLVFSIALFFLLFISNLGLGLWCFRKEKKMIFLAPVIASLRSIAGTLGALKFFFNAFAKRN